MTTKGLHELFSQVLLQLALQIERACGSHVTKGVKAFGQVRFEWSDWHETVDNDSTRGRQLVAYVANTHTPLKNQSVMGMASDKAHPGNLPIANSVLLTPTNFACVCCPNVISPIPSGNWKNK